MRRGLIHPFFTVGGGAIATLDKDKFQSPMTADQFLRQAQDLGMSMGDRPQLQQFFADYLTRP